MTEIAQKLQQQISANGPMSFAEFMVTALYCPKIGYYERPEQVIGRSGDFYTSVSTGPLFGQFLAFQYAEWLQAITGPVQLVEAGAHDGQLALDTLNWLSLNRAGLFQRLEYCLVEPSPTRQAWQKRTLEKFAGQVKWISHLSPSIGERLGVRGIIFSNELLDAFPVHRYSWSAAEQTWFEWGVGFQDGKFVWEKMTSQPMASFMEKAPYELPPGVMAALPDGFTIEHSPAAASWWHNAASMLNVGKLLTIDYGLTEDEMFTPQYAAGTLRSYYRHHMGDPLSNPGEQDLTANVNFSQLQRAGEGAGLRTEGLFTQAQFLVGIAEKFVAKEQPQWSPAQTRQFQTLIHPQFLGRKFRVLIQSR